MQHARNQGWLERLFTYWRRRETRRHSLCAGRTRRPHPFGCSSSRWRLRRQGERGASTCSTQRHAGSILGGGKQPIAVRWRRRHRKSLPCDGACPALGWPRGGKSYWPVAHPGCGAGFRPVSWCRGSRSLAVPTGPTAARMGIQRVHRGRGPGSPRSDVVGWTRHRPGRWPGRLVALSRSQQPGRAVCGRAEPWKFAQCATTRVVLRSNCRNTQQILGHVQFSLGADMGERGTGDGPEVVEHRASDEADAARLLALEIGRILDRGGLLDRDLTILSPQPLAESAARLLPPEVLSRLISLDEFSLNSFPPEAISFAGIDSFLQGARERGGHRARPTGAGQGQGARGALRGDEPSPLSAVVDPRTLSRGAPRQPPARSPH